MKTALWKFDNQFYDPGRGIALRAIWYFICAIFFRNPLNPVISLKALLLRSFGAKVGKGVVLKSAINIKYPWNIEIGDHTWIGENAWLDSLDKIKIGSNVCISQGAYLCTGSHDYKKGTFDLIVKPIVVEDGVWVGAKAVICPGITLGSHCVVTAGSVVTRDAEPYTVYQGNPAVPVRKRISS